MIVYFMYICNIFSVFFCIKNSSYGIVKQPQILYTLTDGHNGENIFWFFGIVVVELIISLILD